MSTDDITNLKYWADLTIKAIIGVIISIVGMDYRSVKNSLRELEESKFKAVAEVQVIQYELNHIKMQIERIEKKLDKLLEK